MRELQSGIVTALLLLRLFWLREPPLTERVTFLSIAELSFIELDLIFLF